MACDGYRRGYVSFVHFLLYFFKPQVHIAELSHFIHAWDRLNLDEAQVYCIHLAILLYFQDSLLKAKTNVRTCFHPGASSQEPNVVKGVQDEVKGRHIIGKMFTYVWPADKPGLRARVLVALGLLVGSKVTAEVQMRCI